MAKRRNAQGDALYQEVDVDPTDVEPAYAIPVVYTREEPNTYGKNANWGGVRFIRPLNAVAYAANDVIGATGTGGAIHEFELSTDERKFGKITKVLIETDLPANVARHSLYLYTYAPTEIADNAQHTLEFAHVGFVGRIDIPAMVTGTADGTAAFQFVVEGAGGLPLPFKCGDNTNKLYGQLVTRDAFTPQTGTGYVVVLFADLQ